MAKGFPNGSVSLYGFLGRAYSGWCILVSRQVSEVIVRDTDVGCARKTVKLWEFADWVNLGILVRKLCRQFCHQEVEVGLFGILGHVPPRFFKCGSPVIVAGGRLVIPPVPSVEFEFGNEHAGKQEVIVLLDEFVLIRPPHFIWCILGKSACSPPVWELGAH
tara:strand:- start:169 stop:654 length:486 start_codon:yes stop_codon:yes gene_type:complete